MLRLARILLAALCAAVHAEDWPQWRGPNRDGVWRETGVMKSLPPAGLRIAWRAAIGPGYSSPVVAAGRVYVTDSELVRPRARERVHCFDETTGKPLWTHSYDVNYPTWAYTEGPGCGPTATPIVDADRLYTLGANGHLLCCDARTGHPFWQKDLMDLYQVQEFACRASPLIEENLLILYIGGRPAASVVALDKNSGKEVWKALDEPMTNSSPLVITAAGKRQLIVWTQNSVSSLDPSTGKTFWREQLVTSGDSAVATPVVQEDRLLIGGLMMKLDADRPAASILWPKTRRASDRILSNTSTPLLRGGEVFSARSSGQLVCLDAHTGHPLWETEQVTDLKAGASIHLTPNGDSVFLYTDKGELTLASLTAKGYTQVSRAHLLDPTWPFAGRNVAWPPPAYANRHVFARNDKEIVCASLAKKP